MTSTDYVVLTVVLIFAAAAIYFLPWLFQQLIKSLHHSLRNSTGGGSAFSPFHELLQPQARHIIEVQKHRHTEDPSGAPPNGDSKPPLP